MAITKKDSDANNPKFLENEFLINNLYPSMLNASQQSISSIPFNPFIFTLTDIFTLTESMLNASQQSMSSIPFNPFIFTLTERRLN